jgi:rod shape-determining protein MreC
MLERVMSDEQVAPGDVVLTSGGDQIFPKGLPVGTVSKVSNGKDLFLNIKVKPASNLSKLEEVLVLLEKQERQAMAEDKRVRAADILAQRLPSVPEKAPDPKTTAAAPGASPDATAPAVGVNSAPKPKTSGALPGQAPSTAKSSTGNAAQQTATSTPTSTLKPAGQTSSVTKPKISVVSTSDPKTDSPPADAAAPKPAAVAIPPNSPPAADDTPH